MKKLFYLAGWLLLFSCNSDSDEIVSPASSPDPMPETSTYAIPVEEALESLYTVLEQIDGANETRAGLMRHAVSVGEVKASAVCDFTRSEQPADLDNLLYVVSFGENKGSAVLGADRRVEPIFAILDETVLTPADFCSDATRVGENDGANDLQTFLTDMIVDAAQAQAVNPINPPTPPINPPTPPILPRWKRTIRRVVTDNSVCAPRLRTKWNQGSPYNDKAPLKSVGEGHCPAGCTVIAVGQFLYNMQLPNFNVIRGVTYDWNLIQECEYGSYPSARACEEVANFIYNLGVSLNADFGDSATGAYLQAALPILSSMGFSAQYREYLDVSAAKQIVCNKGPVCVSGYGKTSGHTWVIDGWDSYRSELVETVTNEAGKIISTTSTVLEEKTLLHCNYGWGGTCDGYYSYKTFVFDVTVPLDEDKIDRTIGDTPVGEGADPDKYRYDRNFGTLIY